MLQAQRRIGVIPHSVGHWLARLQFGLGDLLKPLNHLANVEVADRHSRLCCCVIQGIDRRQNELCPKAAKVRIEVVLQAGIGFDPGGDGLGLKIGDRSLGFEGDLFERSQGVNGDPCVEFAMGGEQRRVNGVAFFDGEKFGGGILHGMGLLDAGGVV
jgi:hypothetical protein